MAKDKTGWILPPEVSDERKCIKIYIPNDVYDRGAFWGALYDLTFSYNWQNGTPEKAREVANMWNEIWQEAYERSNGVNCCNEDAIIKRINPETGMPEVSYNNGASWVPDPSGPASAISLLPPIVTDGGSSTKCDAATNASEHINELIEATHTNLASAATVFELATAVAEAALAIFIVIVSGGTLSPLVATLMAAIWAAATGVFNLGLEAFDAYWTVDKKDAILCALYCNIGENGQFSESQYQAFRAKVKDTLPASPAFDIVMTTINAGGATALSQMASYGNAAEADCSSCDCSDCSCNMSNWDWDTAILGPAVGLVRDEELCELRVDTFESGGTFYWCVFAEAINCCHSSLVITSGTITGSGGMFHAPCDYTGPLSAAIENVGWVGDPLTPPSNNDFRGFLIRSATEFTAKIVFTP